MFHDSMNVVSIPIAKVINELQERGTRASHVQPLERQTNADRAIRRKIQQTQIFILEIRLGGTRFRGSIYRPRSVTYRTLKYSRLRASFFFQNCPLFSCFLSFFKSFISIISYLSANNILNNTSMEYLWTVKIYRTCFMILSKDLSFPNFFEPIFKVTVCQNSFKRLN